MPKGGPQTIETQRYVALCHELMADRGIDQQTAAELLGISADYMSKLLRSVRQAIGAEVVGLACRALNLDANYFFDPYDGFRSYKEYVRRSRRSAV